MKVVILLVTFFAATSTPEHVKIGVVEQQMPDMKSCLKEKKRIKGVLGAEEWFRDIECQEK